ncbi:type II toxin-antitoxin system VapC family toxin [Methylobacterium trifolii]|uniref:type II toxin-antitoxin system VapC family toxin n=1 Tax=Methylobacterium trifolii TaxID=1003092 RepID=UPI001EDC953D|nr:DNA-binding protein [Methylobacterium trifolii]
MRRHDPGTTLRRRPDDRLPFLGGEARAGTGLLLDTCVYIDQMQGRAPGIVEDLLAIRPVHHSAVALQELMHTVGVLDPADARSGRAVASIGTAIDAMPPHRIVVPDLDVLARAAVYAGMLSRNQGYVRDARMSALHDCVLFLQAMKLGFCVLTRNLTDFDLLLQMRPDGRVLFYRT